MKKLVWVALLLGSGGSRLDAMMRVELGSTVQIKVPQGDAPKETVKQEKPAPTAVELAEQLNAFCHRQVSAVSTGSFFQTFMAALMVKLGCDIVQEVKKDDRSNWTIGIDGTLILASLVGFALATSGVQRARLGRFFAHEEPDMVVRILADENACKSLDQDLLRGLREGFACTGSDRTK